MYISTNIEIHDRMKNHFLFLHALIIALDLKKNHKLRIFQIYINELFFLYFQSER